MRESTRARASIPTRIERELARTGLHLRFREHGLERRYLAEALEQSRAHNRVAVAVLVIIFDLFFLPELRVAPEIVGLSACLRFGLLSPACIVFLWLDWRGRLGRWSQTWLTALACATAAAAPLEFLFTASASALPNMLATPLGMLIVLGSRLRLPQVAVIVFFACSCYITGITNSPVVPDNFLPSMILTDLSIGVGLLLFAFRVDARERKLFLLLLQAEERRAHLALQNRALASLSEIDPLTGLGDRRRFDDSLAAVWAGCAARGSPVGLLMCGIDAFGSHGEAVGPAAGDACLRETAAAIADCVRGSDDTLARYGTETFALLLPETSLSVALSVGERLRMAVSRRAVPHPAGGRQGNVTISVGAVSMVPDADDGSVLVAAAAACLRAAMRQGGNRLVAGDAPAPPAVERTPVAAGMA